MRKRCPLYLQASLRPRMRQAHVGAPIGVTLVAAAIVGSPEYAFTVEKLPVCGVGRSGRPAGASTQRTLSRSKYPRGPFRYHRWFEPVPSGH